MSAVTFRDVVVTFGRGKSQIRALDGATVDVSAGGGIFGLLGPSGSGKTTFLLACLRLVNPKSGQVLLYGSEPGRDGLEIPGRNVGKDSC